MTDPSERLRRLERQLDELQQIAHIGSWEWDIARDRVTWSDELFRIYGQEPQSVDCSFESYMAQVHPEDRERVGGTIQAALHRHSEFDFEERIVRPDGTIRTLRSRGRVERDEQGQPVRMIGTCQDITEQVDAADQEVRISREQALRRRAEQEEQRASFLAEATVLLTSSLDFETTLGRIAVLAVSRIADWCAIDLVSETGESERIVIAHPDPAKRELAWELHRTYPPDPNATTGVPEVLRTGEAELVETIPPEVIENAAMDEDQRRILRELDLVSYMVVPMRSGGRAIGAITFVSAESKEHYDADDLRLAQELADRASLAVENARLFREAEGSRTRLTQILESITDAFFALDRDWNFRYVNTEAERLLQRSAEEMLGQSIWELFPAAVGSRFEEMYRQAVTENRTVRFEEFFPPLESWFEVRAYPSPEGLSVYFRNINEERAVQEAVKYSEIRFRSLVEATASIVWNTPASGEFLPEQPGWTAFTGQDAEEYSGYGWLEAIHPDDQEPTRAAWREALRTRSHYEIQHRVLRHDGVYRYMAVRGVPIIDREGDVVEWVGLHTDVTPLREAQEALEHQSYLTRTISDNATSALFMMDAQGRCTYMNAAAVEMTGYSLEEIQDLPLHDAIHHKHPDGRPYPINECPIDRALPEDFSIRAHEDVFIRKDGTFFPVVCAASPIFDVGEQPVGTVVEVRDVTEEKGAAAERERLVQERELERRRLREVFQRAPAFIAVLRGPEHVFESANPNYLALVGREDLLGRSVAEALPEVVEQGFIDLLDTVYRTAEPFVGTEIPVNLARQPGAQAEEVYVNFVYEPLRDPGGTVGGIFVHGVDVTSMVRARREVEAKVEELAELARRLDLSNRELDQFAYVASHDLKAPLRGIANLSTWIEEDLGTVVSDEVRQHLELMRGRVGRMEGLIDGILMYSRAGRARERPEMVDTNALVAEVLDLLAPPPEIRIVTGDLPRLTTERLPLEQVLLNLIGNAIKYNQNPEPWIRIECQPADQYYQFTIRDNGPGIAPEYHERIFGIFQTLEARDKVEGTGIGLSLVKKIVENRGGRVWVESDVGAGSAFHFLWPRHH